MSTTAIDNSGVDTAVRATLVHDSQQRQEIQSRLDELRAERIGFAEQKLRADDALGRAVADGLDETERKKLRMAAAGPAIHVGEIDNALWTLGVRLKQETERAGKAAIADAREAMDRARSEFVATVEDLERTVKDFAPAILPVWDKYLAARHQCFESQARYARTVADDRLYDRASARDLPDALSQERGEVLWPCAHSLVNLAGREVHGRPVMMEYTPGG